MTDMPKEQIFAQCAQVLLNSQPIAEQPAPVQSLLKALEYDRLPDQPASQQANIRHAANMLQAAARFSRLFQLRSPEAPGLIFFGAEVDPADISPGGTGQRRLPASGVGLSFRTAFLGCVGEGVELLSQFQCETDGLFQATLADAASVRHLAMPDTIAGLLRLADRSADTPIAWVTARSMLDNKEAAFPADLCLRTGAGQRLTPPWPLSIGCAAGPSFDAAVLHGLLELIERDAAALWWRGGMRGHVVPLDDEATRRAVGILAKVRGATQRRQSWLLDISSDLGIPCVAAVSVSLDGHGFACGLAARLNLADAAASAIQEMCQMELAHHVVAAKRQESGDAALNALDLAHLRRSNELNIRDCVLLHPLPPRPRATPDMTAADAPGAVRLLSRHLASRGIATFVLDLTRPALGIPVVRVLCPALEKEPSQLVGSRLQAAMQQTGGAHLHTRGVPLM